MPLAKHFKLSERDTNGLGTNILLNARMFINNKRCVSASARDELTAEDIPPFRVRRKE